MAGTKTAKEEAIEEIAAMDKEAPDKKPSTSKPKTTKPKTTAKTENPKEKGEDKKAEVNLEEANPLNAEPITEAEIHAAEKEDARKEIEDAINKTFEQTGFDPDDEDAPEPPETEKVRIVTVKDIPSAQRFKAVSPVVKATKTVMVTTKNMKELLKK